MNKIRLKNREDRRILAGHRWIYSNEIDTAITPLQAFTAGECVLIENAKNRLLGMGYINPNVLLAVRVLSFDLSDSIDIHFFIKRIQKSLALRERFFAFPFYRLVYGESDGLPGLIVDRFGEHVVVQITTSGMEQLKELIIQALIQILKPASIILRNDTSIREHEGLEKYTAQVFGETPDDVLLKENDLLFQVSLFTGQKTGWFYDHRYNRAQLAKYVKDQRVLDLFCYQGSWGIHAAHYGAKEVLCVDSSNKALEHVEHNARLNAHGATVKTLCADAFLYLQEMKQEKQRFDVILLDPPAFIKKRKDIPAGSHAYQRLNALAIDLLSPQGILVTSSCSLHFSKEMLVDAVSKGSHKMQRNAVILASGHQDIDHPIHPSIPETAYLKTLFCSVE